MSFEHAHVHQLLDGAEGSTEANQTALSVNVTESHVIHMCARRNN